jgi:TorA maturation chaperone TorD
MNATAHAAEVERAAQELSAEDRARADMYALIAALFYGPPSNELLALLAAAPKLAGAAEAGLPAAWDHLRRAAARADAGALREVYDACFVTIGEAPVLLYGSHYLAGYLHEKPLAELRTLLAQMGLARKAGRHEPEDHVSALADAMRHLILSGAEDAAQRELFDRFIRPWYARLAERVGQATTDDFYQALGKFTRAFLDVEGESFDLA